ncbi:acyltransferase [Geodermatophilus sp. FMUSA9-8]|uniref:acyltransferase n=1 Tax=Geodermatophilus sp. FMUSA9-8 TaxID=3120155 RepID=UPI0030092432
MSAPARPAASSRVAWTDSAKGLAMVMVVAFHATLYLQSAGVDAVLGRAKAAFELFPMPAFFLIAGLFAGRQAQYQFGDLWRRRLLSLLYLYLLWSVVRTLFYAVVPGLNGELGEIPATDPRALPLVLFWPSSSYWFLYALFLFTLARWLVARLPAWVQLTGSAAVSTAFTTGLLDTTNLGWNRVGALFFFFVLGAVAAPRIRDLVTRARWPHVLGAAAVFVAATAATVLGLRWVPLVVLAGQLAAVLLGLFLCRRAAGSRPMRWLATVGVHSLKIYLLHLFVIVPAVALVELLRPDWPRAVDVAVQVALFVVALSGSFLLARLTGRVRWLWQPPAFLRGGRRRPSPAAGEAPLLPPPAAPLPQPPASPPVVPPAPRAPGGPPLRSGGDTTRPLPAP